MPIDAIYAMMYFWVVLTIFGSLGALNLCWAPGTLSEQRRDARAPRAASARRFGERSIALAATGPWAPSTNGGFTAEIPSGKRLHSYGKSPFIAA